MPVKYYPMNNNKGFSLIELAIVLLIISILIGSFIGTLSQRIDNTRISENEKKLEAIKKSLIGYAYTKGAATNPYLPCPDCITGVCTDGTVKDGVEDRFASGVCSVNNTVGNLPWVSLGLGSGDTWGTRYRYWVDPNYARDTGFALNTAGGAGVVEEPDYSTDHTDAGAALNKALANNVVAVIFSHGKNRYGGINDTDSSAWLTDIAVGDNPDEDENIDAGAAGTGFSQFELDTFVSRPQTSSEAGTVMGEFDDIVVWISEYELKAKMLEAQVLP